ncbi:hypothetical protein K470DRAFT_289905 [Piedraia hortae CBS 480.64]|uniref:Uncharacterized protein n=1 Tax=Piedraia hortae CBS 480.64 TaxID=1314780 RepID=A0A6A7C6M1_9PEZI|nr:hypothetical protein K470DRAFT_289905 [Piedraia hortae CBS 480.64]
MTHLRSDALGHSDADLFDPSRYDAKSGRLSPGDQQVHSRFEQRFVQGLETIYNGYNAGDYYDEAYGVTVLREKGSISPNNEDNSRSYLLGSYDTKNNPETPSTRAW